jgi:hypothetical protein
LTIAASTALAQKPQAPPGDVLCEKLLDEYILRRGKIESANIDAAIQLIASRGRENGFWRVVVDHFQQTPVNDSDYLLEILTKMLQRDGYARWLHSHPEELKRSAWVPNVALPSSVIDTIMTRAKQADRLDLDDYVLAVVAAHDPRTRDFLLAILNHRAKRAAGDLFGTKTTAKDVTTPANPGAKAASFSVRADDPLLDDSQFYAAVGLAELGDVAGLRWLVDANPDIGGSFQPNGGHFDARGDDLQSRALALADLTGQPFETIKEAQTWWAANRPAAGEFTPKARVRLRYP